VRERRECGLSGISKSSRPRSRASLRSSRTTFASSLIPIATATLCASARSRTHPGDRRHRLSATVSTISDRSSTTSPGSVREETRLIIGPCFRSATLRRSLKISVDAGRNVFLPLFRWRSNECSRSRYRGRGNNGIGTSYEGCICSISRQTQAAYTYHRAADGGWGLCVAEDHDGDFWLNPDATLAESEEIAELVFPAFSPNVKIEVHPHFDVAFANSVGLGDRVFVLRVLSQIMGQVDLAVEQFAASFFQQSAISRSERTR
jgi:hypothetical protein